jgi:hypothetical protein
MDVETSNGKWKPRRFFLIRLPVAHCAIESLSFYPFVEKETNESYPFANRLNGFAHLWYYVQVR